MTTPSANPEAGTSADDDMGSSTSDDSPVDDAVAESDVLVNDAIVGLAQALRGQYVSDDALDAALGIHRD